MRRLQESLIALRAENSALHWVVTRPEDNTPAAAVAAGHFVQVRLEEASRSSPRTAFIDNLAEMRGRTAMVRR